MTSPLGNQICEVLLNLQGYCATALTEEVYQGAKEVHIHIKSTKPTMCPKCYKTLPLYDTRVRHIIHASISCRPIVLVLTLRRTQCPVCGVKTENQAIADGIKRHSRELERVVLYYTEKLDNKSTAKLLGFSSSTVYRIDKAGLQNLEQWMQQHIPELHNLSIDELAHKKYHHYTTVLTNQEDGKVIDLSPGKSKKSAIDLFKMYYDKLKWVETIAMDFSHSYVSAVSEWFTPHYIVFDRFHFSRIVNRKLEEVRRSIQQELPDDLKYKSKKDSRWLVLRRARNNTEQHTARLEQLKQDNGALFEAYLIKEELLSTFDDNLDEEEAKTRLLQWCQMAEATDFKPFRSLAKQIRAKLHILLNWFKYHISNAKAEAINNVIKSLLKRAYGYKDYQYFRLKVLQKCGYLMQAITHLI